MKKSLKLKFSPGAMVACLAALLLFAAPAPAFVCLSPSGGVQTDAARCVRWTNGITSMTTLLGSAGSQLFNGTFNWDENVAAAANDWNNAGGGFHFQILGGTFIDPCGRQGAGHACTDTGPIGDNPIFFTDSICGVGFGDIIAQTTNCFDPSPLQPRMVNSPVFFNRNERWNAYDGGLRLDGIIDIRRVLLHELGHVAGLLHPDDHAQSVSAIMNRRVSNLDRLREDDINGLRFLYLGGAPPTGNPPPGAKTGCHVTASSREPLALLLSLPAWLLWTRRRRVPAEFSARGEK